MDASSNRTPRRQSPRTGTARNMQQKAHDPYRHKGKTKGAVVCDVCGAVCHEGRWSWGTPPLGNETGGVCPACQRIRDRCPAATVRLSGLPLELRDEILGLIRNAEERERPEHPLERLIDIADNEGSLVVNTTGRHLARCIASALRRRFRHGIEIHYPEGESVVQVSWRG